MTSDERVSALRRDVTSLRPVDERERRSIRRFLGALDRLERPFDQHADDTHVTASAVVCSPAGVLLHRHKRLGLWMQPGGHVDDDETPAAAARREVIEETGLSADHLAEPPRVVHVDVHAGGRGHTHLDVRYLLHAPAEPPRPPPEESQEVAWFDMTEAIAVADPGLRGLLVQLAGPGLRAM
ncbi:MAG: NUDIX domain-containing protein [Actinobacteria bacterium]|nr:NUDIX domain-containing protein [Actinomycetota bacterium]